MFLLVSKPHRPAAASDEWTAYTSYILQGLALVCLEPACLDTFRRLPNLHPRHHIHAFSSTPNMWPGADWHEDPRAWPFNLMVQANTVHWYLSCRLWPKSGQWPHPCLVLLLPCFAFLPLHKVFWECFSTKHTVISLSHGLPLGNLIGDYAEIIWCIFNILNYLLKNVVSSLPIYLQTI